MGDRVLQYQGVDSNIGGPWHCDIRVEIQNQCAHVYIQISLSLMKMKKFGGLIHRRKMEIGEETETETEKERERERDKEHMSFGEK